MAESLVFGVIASSALVIGALIGVRFELFEDAYERGGICRAVIGLIAGAVVFTVLSALLDRWAQPGPVSQDAERQQGSAKLDTDAAAHNQSPTAASASVAAGIVLLAAVTLDALPENVALGVSLKEGTGDLALLAAIFVSNLPESLMRARWPAATPDDLPGLLRRRRHRLTGGHPDARGLRARGTGRGVEHHGRLRPVLCLVTGLRTHGTSRRAGTYP